MLKYLLVDVQSQMCHMEFGIRLKHKSRPVYHEHRPRQRWDPCINQYLDSNYIVYKSLPVK